MPTVYRDRIPSDISFKLRDALRPVIIKGVKDAVKATSRDMLSNLRKVPNGQWFRGYIEMPDADSVRLNIRFEGTEEGWRNLLKWNYGSGEISTEVISLSREEALREAQRLKDEYASKGWDWRNSRTIAKLEEEHKMFRKRKVAEGKPGTFQLDRIIEDSVNRVLIPKLRGIGKMLESVRVKL